MVIGLAKGEERQKSELLAIGAAKRRCWLVGGKTAKTKFVSTEAGVFGPKGGCAAVNVAQWQLRNACYAILVIPSIPDGANMPGMRVLAVSMEFRATRGLTV